MRKFIRTNLTVHVLKQKNRYIAYSPALDFSTSGKTEKEAKKRFTEASFLFLEELDKAGTLRDVLQELGWRHRERQWTPPQIISQDAVGIRIPVAA